MDVLLLTARLLLAGVLGVAGIAKAADIRGSRRAIADFGIHPRLASVLGVVLPIVEMACAVALVPLDSAWAGAVVALAVLLVFNVVIAVNLARGESPDCHCFGKLHSEPIGWSTLTRNLILMAAAGLIVVEGKQRAGLSALSWLADLRAAEAAGLAIGVASSTLLVVGLINLRRVLNQQAVVLERIDALKRVIDEDYAEAPVERAEAAAPAGGLPIGAPAPDWSLETIHGDEVALGDLLAQGKTALLLFVSPNCAPCKTLLPDVNDWQRDYEHRLTIAFLSKGTAAENRDWMTGSPVRHLLLQGESGVADDYDATWTPAAVMVSSDGRIASPIAFGDDAIRQLMAREADRARGPERRALRVVGGNGGAPRVTILTPEALNSLGQRAPEFSLSDLNGGFVGPEDFAGRDTLLLFWDPKCPFCREMIDDLLEWEKHQPRNAPRLVFVSSGAEEDVRTESARFESQFLYDPEFDVGIAFGTNRTPSAVLIDRNGRIASAPTGGRMNILLLAGVRRAAITAR